MARASAHLVVARLQAAGTLSGTWLVDRGPDDSGDATADSRGMAPGDPRLLLTRSALRAAGSSVLDHELPCSATAASRQRATRRSR